jgi:hypothetical protein
VLEIEPFVLWHAGLGLNVARATLWHAAGRDVVIGLTQAHMTKAKYCNPVVLFQRVPKQGAKEAAVGPGLIFRRRIAGGQQQGQKEQEALHEGHLAL